MSRSFSASALTTHTYYMLNDLSRQEQNPTFGVPAIKKLELKKLKFSRISKKFIQVYK